MTLVEAKHNRLFVSPDLGWPVWEAFLFGIYEFVPRVAGPAEPELVVDATVLPLVAVRAQLQLRQAVLTLPQELTTRLNKTAVH